MIDKVQKIREEIVGIINSINLFTPDEDGKNSSYEAGKLYVASKILQIIDSMQEEPVSEDLEEAAQEYTEKGSKCQEELDAFKAGANWQKQKDESKVLTEEQCRKLRDDAFELGKDVMKQQMMAKAVDARCFGFQGAALFSFGLPAKDYLVGSKIKVIIIKE